MKPSILGVILKFAQTLKFRQLFLLTGGLFLLDLVIPDRIPFADELLLGLVTLLLASWKKEDNTTRAQQPGETVTGRVIEGEVTDKKWEE